MWGNLQGMSLLWYINACNLQITKLQLNKYKEILGIIARNKNGHLDLFTIPI